MSHEVYWGDEHKSVLHQRYTDNPNLMDYYQVTQKTYQMLSTVQHPVDIIIELCNCTVNTQETVSAIQHSQRNSPPNRRMVIFTGASTLVQNLITDTNLSRTSRRHRKFTICFTANVEGAYALLQEYRDRGILS
jgi:hypothetical protein